MNNKIMFFLTAYSLISLVSSMTIESCSSFAMSGDIGKQGNKTPSITQSYSKSGTQMPLSTPISSVLPTTNSTPLSIEAMPISEQPFSIFHVSISGSNTDGKSWNTAWNELDQIQWDKIAPGDTIMIRGGEYHTQLNINKDGTADQPITITTNGEQVILDGHRPLPPYCGQMNYVSVPGENAVTLDGRSNIVIDGQDWKGIIIRNYVRGIRMRQGTRNIVVRNVEIYDNGWSSGSGASIWPDGSGIELGGSDILFERVIIHDNGQDAFQAGWGVWNFTLRNSWLYNSREHPFERGKSFNYCSHTDGIQIYAGGTQGPIVIENSIIGPSFTQGVITGDNATVDNVVIRNTLFVGNDNAGIIVQDDKPSSNWTLENITIVQDTKDERSGSLTMYGSGHQIRDSIFSGGSWGIMIPGWSEAAGNFNWLSPDPFNVAEEMDPMFVDDEYDLVQGKDFAGFDFKIQNPQIPSGTGTSITSLAKLFGQ